VTSNICSRLRRAELLTDSGAIESSVAFKASIAAGSAWQQIPNSSQSGILRAVHLYEEFLSLR